MVTSSFTDMSSFFLHSDRESTISPIIHRENGGDGARPMMSTCFQITQAQAADAVPTDARSSTRTQGSREGSRIIRSGNQIGPGSTGQDFAGLPHRIRTCLPISERAGRDVGCWLITAEPLGRLTSSAVFWHLDTYPTRAATRRCFAERGGHFGQEQQQQAHCRRPPQCWWL